MPKSLVYLLSAPAPNHIDAMERAASAVGRDSVHMIFCQQRWESASFSVRMPEACHYHCIDGPKEMNGVPLANLPALLGQIKPSVAIVCGHHQRANRAAIAWCRRNDVSYCLQSDSNIYTDYLKGWLKHIVRKVRLEPFVRRAYRILIGGQFNRRFFERYGMRPEQEFWWPMWVDYASFAKARVLRAAERQALREEFGIRTRLNFIHVGRVIPLKKVDLLCEALLEQDEDVGLIVVGHGEQEPLLRERYLPRLGDRLRLMGRASGERLIKLYAAGDVLVLGSGPREQWGLVLNEATTAGLPIICNRRVGAAGDLLHHERNGIALEEDTREQWSAAMRKMAADPALVERMSRESVAISDDWRARSDPAERAATLLNERLRGQ